MASAVDNAAAAGAGAAPAADPQRSIPVTMLSGFLGAGKTTVLRHLLQNADNLKIGCVVNDVADVNIDAKLVRNDRSRQRGGGVGGDGNNASNNGNNNNNTTSDLADTIELANGCACCSIQDELFGSFEQLLSLADAKGATYDRIVLENSGVAEPQNIRDKFSEAVANGHPLSSRLHLDTLVTVVDSASFVADFASRAPLAARPDLGEGGNLRPVVDLLVEQVECADWVILNKVDQLIRNDDGDESKKEEAKEGGKKEQGEKEEEEGGEEEPRSLQSLRAIVASLNPLARVTSCERGRVDVAAVFGKGGSSSSAGGGGGGIVAHLNVEGQHRGAVAHATALAAAEKEEEGGGCAVCAATGDDKKNDGDGKCGHDHHHHDHDQHHHHHHHHEHHGEAHHGSDCAAKGCTEDGHGHHHHHHDHDGHGDRKKKKLRQETTAAARFGIRSFVYRRRRPFHPGRLRDTVLRWLPVATNSAMEDDDGGTGAGKGASAGNEKEEEKKEVEEGGKKDDKSADDASNGATDKGKNSSPIRAVLRSKGFMWMSHSHSTAFYWSHAGQHFEIRDEGDWWAAVPADEWPSDYAQRAVILADFDPKPKESAGGEGDAKSSSDVMSAALASSRYGDRRQEVVFIGAGMDESAICAALDAALLTDAELGKYDANFGVPPLPDAAAAVPAAAAPAK